MFEVYSFTRTKFTRLKFVISGYYTSVDIAQQWILHSNGYYTVVDITPAVEQH